MNEPENNLPAASRSVAGDENYENLRRQINLLFGALIVTSFTLTAYLGLQARRASVELLAIQPRADEATRLLQQDDASAKAAFSKLEDFGRTHPDFQARILSKYKVNTNAPMAAPIAAPKK
jgi:hypothetical protein